ncbi:Metallothiol transferase FosB [Polystyrenella longa]|uniref:Metallothiol transferase FosB n=1 Tax=Polystyrenella longa TaxID=2528007 RepID=A0A518CS70_9PLAN|nr:VOC family protein [Polystyrenella longa]QDU82079.1 Metallothiol transferase FosB [Polystyrenella longa]
MTGSTSASHIQVKSIDHVTLVSKDMEKSRHFYVDVLGMEDVPRPAFSFAGKWFQAGETMIHIIEQHDQSGPAGNQDVSGYTETRTHHFAFLVDDALSAQEVLNANKVPIVCPAKKRPDGATQVFVLDPDGYVVELSSLPE